jgi:hypothetical protein
MRTNKEEVRDLIFDTDLYMMLPKKGYDIDYLFYCISADVNTHHVSNMGTQYDVGKKRTRWLIGRIHSELSYYCPKDNYIPLDKILVSYSG